MNLPKDVTAKKNARFEQEWSVPIVSMVHTFTLLVDFDWDLDFHASLQGMGLQGLP